MSWADASGLRPRISWADTSGLRTRVNLADTVDIVAAAAADTRAAAVWVGRWIREAQV